MSAAALLPLAAVEDAEGKRRMLGDRTLTTGMRGTDVRVLQDFLTRLGFRTPVDGQFGPQTRARVRSFERRERLRRDGRLTRREARRLRDVAENAPERNDDDRPGRPTQIGRNGGALFQGDEEQATPTVAPTPGTRIKLTEDGLAIPPQDAPPQVQQIIAAANKIATKPYVYGGGHKARFSANERGYDCSGSVSYALSGANLLDAPRASGGFMRWGAAGKGQWVTIYTKASHMYMVVGLPGQEVRFDTSGAKAAGSRWQTSKRSTRGYTVRRPSGSWNPVVGSTSRRR